MCSMLGVRGRRNAWLQPILSYLSVMCSAKKSDMKISYQRSKGARHGTALFVVISKFDTDNFSVPVRFLLSGRTKVSKTCSGGPSVTGKVRRERNWTGDPPH